MVWTLRWVWLLPVVALWGKSPATVMKEFPTPFCYFENLYFDEEQALFITLRDRKVFPPKVMTPLPKRGYSFQSRKGSLPNVETVEGTTLFLFEMNRTICCSYHFFHILEHVVGDWAFYGDTHFADVKQIVLASAGEKVWIMDGRAQPVVWEGTNEINKHLLRALFPNAEVKTWLAFREAYRGKTIRFERAFTSDREIAEENSECSVLGRMLGFSRHYMSQDALQRMAEKVHAYAETRIEKSPFLRVTYLKRAPTRYLAPELEAQVLSSIRGLQNVVLRVEDFAKLTFQEQINIIGNTDVLLSVHGNGLSHSLFLPPSSKVIEIFPPSAHTLDYRIFAEARGHDYRCVISNKGVISQEESTRLSMCGDLLGTIYELDIPLLLSQITSE